MYRLLLSDFNETWIFSTDFRKYSNIIFTKIRPAGAEFFHEQMYGRTDRHNKANTLLFAILHTRLWTLDRWANSEVCCKCKKLECRAFDAHGGIVVNDDHKRDFFANKNLLLPFIWKFVMIDGQAHYPWNFDVCSQLLTSLCYKWCTFPYYVTHFCSKLLRCVLSPLWEADSVKKYYASYQTKEARGGVVVKALR